MIPALKMMGVTDYRKVTRLDATKIAESEKRIQ